MGSSAVNFDNWTLFMYLPMFYRIRSLILFSFFMTDLT